MLSDANICVVLCYCVYAGISSLLGMPLPLLNGRSGANTDIKTFRRTAAERNFGKLPAGMSVLLIDTKSIKGNNKQSWVIM